MVQIARNSASTSALKIGQPFQWFFLGHLRENAGPENG
jgi:hypothetical protein